MQRVNGMINRAEDDKGNELCIGHRATTQCSVLFRGENIVEQNRRLAPKGKVIEPAPA